jgi:phosphatidylglycerol:prolipoprotein diacylglycerol transferase
VLDLVFPLTSGFSAFGVFAGMAAGVLCFCRLFRYPYRRTLDYLCAVLPFWLATARIGCFFTGCCYGRPVRHAWPWAVTFTDPASALPRALLGVPLHPSQLYEALGDLLLGLALLPVLRAAERGELPLGTSCCAFLAGYGLLRFGLEPFRGDALTWGAISMGQFCALAFIALAMAGWLRLRAGSRSRRVLGSL